MKGNFLKGSSKNSFFYDLTLTSPKGEENRKVIFGTVLNAKKNKQSIKI